MYLRSASPSNAWQPRRGFSGLAGKGTYRSRRLRGMGQGGDTIFDPTASLPLDTTSIDTTSLMPATLPSDFFNIGTPIAPPITNYPTMTPPTFSVSTSGVPPQLWSAPGAAVNLPANLPAATPFSFNTILQAFGIGTNVAKAVTGSATRPAAPAGYAYNSAGQLVPVSAASSLLSGGASTLLLLGGGVFLLAAVMGGRK